MRPEGCAVYVGLGVGVFVFVQACRASDAWVYMLFGLSEHESIVKNTRQIKVRLK